MRKKNILFILLIFTLTFMGMIRTNAFEDSYTGTEERNCEYLPYYYKSNSSVSVNMNQMVGSWLNNAFPNKLIDIYPDGTEGIDGVYPKSTGTYDWGDLHLNKTELQVEQEALEQCSTESDQYCLRVSHTCRYYVGNQEVFCLDGATQFISGSNITYNINSDEIENTVENKGMACALVELYGELHDSLEFDAAGNLNINAIPTENIIAIQKKMWSHQYDGVDCTQETDRTVPIDSNGNVSLTSSEGNIPKLKLNTSLGYYVSPAITVTATNINQNEQDITLGLYISVPDGTVISSSSTQVKPIPNNKVQSGAVVYIMVPARSVTGSHTFHLNANASVKTQENIRITSKFQVYTSPGTGSQKMGIPKLHREITPVYNKRGATMFLTVEKNYGSIKITKKDSVTDAPLQGVKFTIKKKNGNEYEDAVDINGKKYNDVYETGSNGVLEFNNLLYGTYEVTETQTLNGYVINEKTKLFEIGATNATTCPSCKVNFDVEWQNSKIKIRLNKKDYDKKTTLVSGSTLVVLDSSFKAYNTGWNNSLQMIEFAIVPGIYYLYESSAPEGYACLGEKNAMKFEVDNVGTIKNVKYGSLDLKNKKFNPSTDNKSDYYSYKNNNGSYDEIDVYNKVIYVKISKKSITGTDELEGAKIKITSDKEGFKPIEFVSTKSPHEFPLPHLSDKEFYYMEETAAPVGYEPLLTVFKFSVLEDGTPKLIAIGKWDSNKKFKEDKNLTDKYVKFPGSKDKDQSLITLLNEPIKTIIYKKDANGDKVLDGAVFVLKNLTTGKETKIITTKDAYKNYFGPGEYSLVETESPEGYEKNETEFKFKILPNGDIELLSEETENIKVEKNVITIYNTVVVTEDTGNNSFIFPVLGALILLIGGSIIYFVIRKKQVSNF